MRLFLASYRFGAHRDRLLTLLGTPPGRVAVIANAADAWPASARASAVTSDIVPLQKLGFSAEEVDLREYVGRADDLAETLSAFPLLWVRGGNTFVLRAQFARSGADVVLPQLLGDDRIVYAGYSAGACVLTPSLHGLESSDDPDEVQPTCGIEPIWSGLGLVDRAIVPHWQSQFDDPAVLQRVAEGFRDKHVPFWTLTDEQVVVVDGPRVDVL